MNRKAFFLLVLASVCLSPLRAEEIPSVQRLDPALDELLPPGASLKVLAEGFGALEGPVWVQPEGEQGFLLFSDMSFNLIHKWTPDGKITAFRNRSGYSGPQARTLAMQVDEGRGMFALIGPSGITVDPQGRIVFCAQGDRAVVRLEKDGQRTVLADSHQGRRLTNPNDLVYRSDGSLYFTDAATGLRVTAKPAEGEVPGVYRVSERVSESGNQFGLELLSSDLESPDGLAFSPDEKHLYVADAIRRRVMRFEVAEDGGLSRRRVFIDMSAHESPKGPDGLKVDREGNVYCAGPGGVWVIAPSGKHLGTIPVSAVASNVAFGGADGKTLFVTGSGNEPNTGMLYSMRVKIAGSVLKRENE